MTEQFANFAQSSLAAPITANQTTISVASASTFPLVGNFHIVVQSFDVTTQVPTSAPEIMIVTAVAGKTFTVTRGAENTPAIAFASGAQVTNVVTAGVMQALAGGGSGSVTQVNTGTGLTGGPITSTGTISIANNTVNTLAGYNNSGVFSSVAIGTNLTLSGGTLTASGGSGTVSQVNSGTGLSGGPITTTGTFTVNLSTGVAGGQTAIGGTASGNGLTLSSTSNATKGGILLGSAGTSRYAEATNQLLLGVTTGYGRLHSALDVPGNYDSVETISQLVLSGLTNKEKQFRIGFDTLNNQAYMQATIFGSAVNPILLNPDGGSVAIGGGGAYSPRSLFDVAGTATTTGLTIPTGAVGTYVWTCNGAGGDGSWQPSTGGGGGIPNPVTIPVLFDSVSGGIIQDSVGINSIDPDNRQLISAGTNTAIDWSVNDRLCIGAPASVIDDGQSAFQVQSNGSSTWYPASWGVGTVIQYMRFGDPYHQIVNIYGGGFFYSTYPGINDPLNFGQNYDQSFGLPRGSAIKIIPSGANPPVLQAIIGNEVFSEAGDGATGLQVTSDMKLKKKLLTYNNITTTGNGIPAIYGTGRFTAQTAAKATVATFTPTVDASFWVSANILVTTATIHSFTGTVSYTDEGNTARVVTMQFSTLAGAFVTAITNAQGAVPYEGVPLHIRVKANTAVTISTTGTFTTVTYNVEGSIVQIA